MPRDLHCHPLRHSGAYHVSYTGPAEIMKNLFILLHPLTSAGLTGNRFFLLTIKSPGVDINVRSSTTAKAFKSFIIIQ